MFDHIGGGRVVDSELLLVSCALLLFVSFLVITSPSCPYLSAPIPAAYLPPPPVSPLPPTFLPPPPPFPPHPSYPSYLSYSLYPLEVGEASDLPPPPPPYSCDPSGNDLPQGK